MGWTGAGGGRFSPVFRKPGVGVELEARQPVGSESSDYWTVGDDDDPARRRRLMRMGEERSSRDRGEVEEVADAHGKSPSKDRGCNAQHAPLCECLRGFQTSSHDRRDSPGNAVFK